MMSMNMWGASLRTAISIDVILDVHNVFSHSAIFLDCFKRYPKLAARISTQASIQNTKSCLSDVQCLDMKLQHEE